MPDKKQIGAGSVLKLGDGAVTEAFTSVAKIRSIDPITQTKPLVDVTDLDSTGREYIGGLADGDEFGVTASLLMDEVTHGEASGLDKVFLDGQARNFELIPNAQSKKLKFAAICTQRGFGGFDADGVMMHTWRMKISGGVTIANVVA
jgi:predicted secreted protein